MVFDGVEADVSGVGGTVDVRHAKLSDKGAVSV
jgi:hypothetical protein